MPIGRQLIRNVLSSGVGYAVRIAIAFFFVPYITAVLGTERYGIWVIIFQAINYLSLLDFGFERALLRYISKFLGRNDFDSITGVLSTATAAYFGFGLLVLVGGAGVGLILFPQLCQSYELLAETQTAFYIVVAFLAARFWLMPFAGSFGGLQRYDILNALEIAEELVRVGILIAILTSGYGLVALALALFGVSLIRQVVALIIVRKLFPRIHFSRTAISWSTARLLTDYSKVSFAIAVGWMVIFNTDSILLGLLASPAAAGIYAPGASVMLYLRMIVNTVGTPLTPAVSQLEGMARSETIRELYLKGIRYFSFASFFLAVGVIQYAKPFVGLWLRPEYAESADVMIVLSVGAAFFLPHIIGNSVLFGVGRHKFLLWVLMAEAALKIILSIFLIEPYGPVGMAIAVVAPQVILYTTAYPFLLSRVVGARYYLVLITGLVTGLFAIVISWPASYLLKLWFPPETWPNLLLNIVSVTLIAIVAGYFVVLLVEDRSRIKTYLGGLVGR